MEKIIEYVDIFDETVQLTIMNKIPYGEKIMRIFSFFGGCRQGQMLYFLSIICEKINSIPFVKARTDKIAERLRKQRHIRYLKRNLTSSEESRQVLIESCENGHGEVIKYFNENKKMNNDKPSNSEINFLFRHACSYNHPEIIRYFIESKMIDREEIKSLSDELFSITMGRTILEVVDIHEGIGMYPSGPGIMGFGDGEIIKNRIHEMWDEYFELSTYLVKNELLEMIPINLYTYVIKYFLHLTDEEKLNYLYLNLT